MVLFTQRFKTLSQTQMKSNVCRGKINEDIHDNM